MQSSGLLYLNIHCFFLLTQLLLPSAGYLGDRMEKNCHIVKSTTLPRRVGDCLTNALDSILFMTTYAVMLAIYAYVIAAEKWSNA